MTYKERFFAHYGATHLTPRKGAVTPEGLRERAVAWQQQFREFLPTDPDARILDAGCGYGAVVWWLQAIGYRHAEGIDVSGEQVDAGAMLGISNLARADVEEFLAGREGTYDAIIARDLLEHLPRDVLVCVVDGMHRALRKGGVLIIQAPNAESPFGGRIRYGDFTHELAFTSASISQLLRVSGFARVVTRPVRPVLRGLRSRVRALSWRLVEAAMRAVLTAEVGCGNYIVTQNLLAVAWKEP